MELKRAVAVCLIALFSATLVVMIARALDSQAASRIEPQLALIVEELQAIRKQGGISASQVMTAKGESVNDGLTVYYFHGNTRCPTCQSIESQSHEAVQSTFAEQLDRGEITWKILNYEQAAVSALTKKFAIQMPVIVLAKVQGGQIEDWKRLDEVWALVGDKPAFAAYVRDEVRRMLGTVKVAARTASAPKTKRPSGLVAPAVLPASLPLAKPAANLPLPK